MVLERAAQNLLKCRVVDTAIIRVIYILIYKNVNIKI